MTSAVLSKRPTLHRRGHPQPVGCRHHSGSELANHAISCDDLGFELVMGRRNRHVCVYAMVNVHCFLFISSLRSIALVGRGGGNIITLLSWRGLREVGSDVIWWLTPHRVRGLGMPMLRWKTYSYEYMDTTVISAHLKRDAEKCIQEMGHCGGSYGASILLRVQVQNLVGWSSCMRRIGAEKIYRLSSIPTRDIHRSVYSPGSASTDKKEEGSRGSSSQAGLFRADPPFEVLYYLSSALLPSSFRSDNGTTSHLSPTLSADPLLLLNANLEASSAPSIIMEIPPVIRADTARRRPIPGPRPPTLRTYHDRLLPR
jgi:hypothetical protein